MDNKKEIQDIIAFQETLNTEGWIVYQKILTQEIIGVDNTLHNTKDDFRYYQGQYDAHKRILGIPDRLEKRLQALNQSKESPSLE